MQEDFSNPVIKICIYWYSPMKSKKSSMVAVDPMIGRPDQELGGVSWEEQGHFIFYVLLVVVQDSAIFRN